MQEWMKVSMTLCIFGFLRDIRPSEPYATEYFLGPWRNLTEEQVNQDVYPISIYAYLGQLIWVFLITDFLRYKPLIILMGICGIVIWCMILWTTSFLAIQIFQMLYGTYTATEVAYYTYIYAKVDKAHYAKVTSYTRSSMMMGKLIASILSQVLIYFKLMNYRDLNYISLATQILATIWAFFIPSVKNSLYFHQAQNTAPVTDSNKNVQNQVSRTQTSWNFGPAFRLLWTHFYHAYSNRRVLQWSLWYIVGLSGQLQVLYFVQVLWKAIDSSPPVVWNGAVDTVLTITGAAFSLAAGYIFTGKTNSRLSLFLLALLSVLEGICLLMAAWTTNLYISYLGYICFCTIYAFVVTVSSSEVSRNLPEESYGLIFGINTFFALCLQTILTLSVVSKYGLALNAIDQFTVYAFYFIIVGMIYVIVVIIDYIVRYCRSKNSFELSRCK